MAHLHEFARGPAHQEGWRWFEKMTKTHAHLSFMHEVYAMPKGHWENVYRNFTPFGMGEFWELHGSVYCCSTEYDCVMLTRSRPDSISPRAGIVRRERGSRGCAHQPTCSSHRIEVGLDEEPNGMGRRLARLIQPEQRLSSRYEAVFCNFHRFVRVSIHPRSTGSDHAPGRSIIFSSSPDGRCLCHCWFFLVKSCDD